MFDVDIKKKKKRRGRRKVGEGDLSAFGNKNNESPVMCKDAKALTPINYMLRHMYLQYTRSRSRMTWPP